MKMRATLALVVLLVGASVARAEIVDKVALVVNGRIVTLSELEERAGPGLPPRDATGTAAERRLALLKRAADDAVADVLFREVADDQGLVPTQAEIDAAIENIMRENKIDQRTLETALAQQGLTMERYREMLQTQLMRMKVAEVKVKSRVTVSDDDVRRRYEEMAGTMKTSRELHLRDILVPFDEDRAAAKAKAEAARARVLKGEKFETVARETGGPFAEAGGDLGWVKPGDVIPALEDVAQKLEKGKVSEVFEAGGGYHVLYVEDARAAGGARSLAESREELRGQLLSERLGKATEEYVADLRRTADIDVRLP